MLPGKRYSARDLITIARRRLWVVLLPGALGSVGLFSAASVVGSVFVGLVIGVVLVAVLESRESSFSREEDIQRVLALPVLGTVPLILSESERQLRARQHRAVRIAEVLLAVAIVVALWTLRS